MKTKTESTKKEWKCCICGKTYTGWGNNPWPVKENGRCCDWCNETEVIPARIFGLKK